jgi:hypothetical protein
MDKRLIDLDECVVNALELFIKNKLKSMNLPKFKRPLVVGSGNAAVTGRILFEGSDAVFADESNYKLKLKSVKNIDGGILISASGGKHAPIIARELKKRGKKVVLITCNENALAKKYADKVFVSPKNVEPYTYNTSTYMGMILSKTKENPKKILQYLKKIKVPNLKKYNAYFIIVPEEFDNVRELFVTKFNELFGPMINGRVATPEQMKHAKTVIPSDKELFIGLGFKNKLWGKKRWDIKLPKGAKHAAIMAIGYYIIGKMQKQHKPYFKQNIVEYTKEISKVYGQEIKPIVE